MLSLFTSPNVKKSRFGISDSQFIKWRCFSNLIETEAAPPTYGETTNDVSRITDKIQQF